MTESELKQGQSAPKQCPICAEIVKGTHLPTHIRNHGGDHSENEQ